MKPTLTASVAHVLLITHTRRLETKHTGNQILWDFVAELENESFSGSVCGGFHEHSDLTDNWKELQKSIT